MSRAAPPPLLHYPLKPLGARPPPPLLRSRLGVDDAGAVLPVFMGVCDDAELGVSTPSAVRSKLLFSSSSWFLCRGFKRQRNGVLWAVFNAVGKAVGKAVVK